MNKRINSARLWRRLALSVVVSTAASWAGCGGTSNVSSGGPTVVSQPPPAVMPQPAPTAAPEPPAGRRPPPPPPLAVPEPAPPEYAPGRVIVKLKDSVRAKGGGAPREINVYARSVGLTLIPERRFQTMDMERLKISSQHSVEEAVAKLSRLPEVEFAEPDFLLRADDYQPNDPLIGHLWGLQNLPVPGADINVRQAWQVTTGSPEVVVAVIDSGVDYNHPDLAPNMWVNLAEQNGTAGVDDDGNGFVDDIHGINAITGSGDPMDDYHHGTHVAGTIAAAGNNGVGVVGVAPSARIMALKFLNAQGSGWSSDAIICLDYALAQGVKLSNHSWGGANQSAALSNAIKRAGEANHLVVASSGNAGLDLDLGDNQNLPASATAACVLSVGAHDDTGRPSPFSNYGVVSVDLFAPGEGILSTVPGGHYEYRSGTSMATPYVTGVAALLMSQMGPTATYQAVRSRITRNVDKFDSFTRLCVSGGRLNAYHALNPGANASPAPPLPEALIPEPGPPTPERGAITLNRGWTMLSFPVGEVSELELPKDADAEFWLWDAEAQDYQQIPATADAVNAGSGTSRGFWVYSDEGGSLGFAGTGEGDHRIALPQGWNLIGFPYEEPLSTSEVAIVDMADARDWLPLNQAGCVSVPPADPCLVFGYVFTWAGNYRGLNVAANPRLEPDRAHWIHVGRPAQLNAFPVGASVESVD